MARLQNAGLVDTIRALRQPLLGICVGMQLLFESSEEGDVACLGLLPGRVRRFADRDDLPVPHMGWNQLEFAARLAAAATTSLPATTSISCTATPRRSSIAHARDDASYGEPLLRPRPARQRLRRAVPSGALRARRRAAAAQLPAAAHDADMELIPAIDLRDGRCVRLLQRRLRRRDRLFGRSCQRARALSRIRRRDAFTSSISTARATARNPIDDVISRSRATRLQAAGGRRPAYARASPGTARRRRRARRHRQRRRQCPRRSDRLDAAGRSAAHRAGARRAPRCRRHADG